MENVTSVLGGKTHLADTDSPVPFPLCGSASRNTRTRFRTTTAAVDCRECTGILARRAARLARETAAPQTGDRVTIIRGQDPYLPNHDHTGLTGTLIGDHSANEGDVVRYTVQFGDDIGPRDPRGNHAPRGRRGDPSSGWVWCAEIRPA